MSVANNNTVLDLSKFRSLNQVARHEGTSERYAFIPTTQPLQVLMDNGWQPVKVMEHSAYREDRKGFQKHVVRLRREQDIQSYGNRQVNLNDCFPEIVVMNSHDGLCSFRLMCGIFELVCTNGLVVQREGFGSISVRHKGYADQKVQVALDNLTQNIPQILDSRQEMKGVPMDNRDVQIFANRAAMVRWDIENGRQSVESRHLTRVHHRGQEPTNLWDTFNIVQENMLNGKMPVVTKMEDGKTNVRKAKAIKSPTENIKVNQDLWKLAEEMYEMKTGRTL